MSSLVQLSLVLALTGAPTGETHLDEQRGFRIEVPDGWTPVEQDQADGSHVLYLLPPGTRGEVLVGVTHRELPGGLGVEDLLKGSLARIEGAPEQFSDVESGEVELLGRTCPALSVVFDSPQQGPLRIDAFFLERGGHGYTVQRVAPPDTFDRWSEQLDAAVATLALVEPSPAALRLGHVAELAARCGSELDWAADWDAAAARARELGRPVLVVLWLYRGFDLPTGPRSTTFSDDDVLALVKQRYVPYWHRAGARAAFAERYGMSATSFGQALMVATPQGEVLAQTEHATETDAAYEFLRREALAWSGARDDGGTLDGAPLEVARALVDRGELERALELDVLGEPASTRARLLRIRALRLLRRGDETYAAVRAARELDDGDDAGLAARLLLEDARASLRLRRDAEARSALALLGAEHGATESAQKGVLLAAMLDLKDGERERGRARLDALVDAQPDSPAAWQAAALLASGVLEIDFPLDFGWPDERLFREASAAPAPSPLPTDRAGEARDDALEWLLAAQRADGSWISPTELGHADDGSPHPFVDALTALAVRALVAHTDDPRALPAIERGLAFLTASVERRRTSPTRIQFMDYTPWSDGALLDTVATLLAAGLGQEQALRATASELIDDLAARAQPHGGWGYYVSGELNGPAGPPTSMSFTTAAAVLALAHARRAGLEVPEALLEGKGVAALQAMRDAQGIFAYSMLPGGGAGVAPAMVPGAVGRSPVCELALLRADASEPARVRRALELFGAQADTYAAEQGKVIMHAGAAAQGCHYLLFDFAWAAEAWREVEGDARTRVRLLELVLDCRQADGSFLDTPINGRAYGTAMALLALDALGVDGLRVGGR